MKAGYLLGAALFVFSFAAPAATITHERLISDIQFDFTSEDGNEVYLDLPQFDATLGQLNSVTLLLIGDVDALIGVENLRNTNPPRTFTPRFSASIEVFAPTASLNLNLTPALTGSPVVLQRYDGSLNYGGASGFTYTSTAVDSATATTSNPLDFSSYVGPGSFQIRFEGRGTGGILETFTNYSLLAQGAADLTAQVTYDYTAAAVPEPAAVLLAAVGFLLVGVRRLRG